MKVIDWGYAFDCHILWIGLYWQRDSVYMKIDQTEPTSQEEFDLMVKNAEDAIILDKMGIYQRVVRRCKLWGFQVAIPCFVIWFKLRT